MPDKMTWGDSSKGAPPNDVVLQRWPFGSPGGKADDAALPNISDALQTIYGGIPNSGPIPAPNQADFEAMSGIGDLGKNAKTDWWKDFRKSDNVEYDPSVADPSIGGTRMLKQWAQLEAMLQKIKEASGPPPTPIPPLTKQPAVSVDVLPFNMQKPTSVLPTPAGLPVFPTMGIRG